MKSITKQNIRYFSFRVQRKLAKIRLRKRMLRFASLLFFLGIIEVIFLMVGHPKSVDAAWYNTGWSFRKQLTINDAQTSGSSDFTNFPVLVSITDPNLQASAQSDGDDILFTSSDGATKLDHDIEKYDSTTGQLIAWVEVPTLYAQKDTQIYLYYGNASATSQQNATGTWDSNFRGVWHVAEGTGTNADDETSNTNDLTLNTAGWGSGKIDGAWDGEGAKWLNQGADDADMDFVAADNFTLSFWFKSDSSTNPVAVEYLLSKGGNNNVGYYIRASGSGDGTVVFATEYTGDGNSDDTANSVIDVYDGQWHYLSAVKTGTTNVQMFIDGSLKDTDSAITNSTLDTAQFFRLGDLTGADNGNEFLGDLDEPRVAATNRTADWIATEYNNQSNPAAFYSASTQQTQREPVLYWSFDEGSGSTVHDSTKYANDGTFNAANPTWQSEDMCVAGKCLRFDGTDDTLNRAYSADTELDPGTASFSASAWFRHVTTTPSTSQGIVSRLRSGIGWKIYMNTSSQICFGIDDDSSGFPEKSACTTTAYNDNRWHFAEGVKSGTSTITLYIDGKQITQTSLAGTTGTLDNGTTSFYVGSNNGGADQFWNGFIDEVKFFDYEKSAAQIQADYSSKGGVLGASASFGSLDAGRTLSNGLVGYWKLDEASGLTKNCTAAPFIDSSGNENNGQSCLSTNGPDGGAVGKFGNGVTFDGSNDYINIPDTASLDFGSGSITSSAWVKTSSSTAQHFVAYGEGGSYRLRCGTNSSGRGWIALYTGSSWLESIATTGNIEDGNWHLVTCVYDRTGNAIFYLDGINIASVSIASAASLAMNDGDITLGFDSFDNTNLLNGRLDDVRIYNRALSSSEVSFLNDWAPGPVGYWNMDEGSGTTAADSSGNTNTGTLTNGPEWKIGKYGEGITFDGSNDYLDIGTGASIGPATSFTAEAWINQDTSASGVNTIFASGSNDLLNWSMDISATGKLDIRLDNNTSFPSTTTITKGVWHHVAVTKNGDSGTNASIYIDGILDTQVAVGPLSASTGTKGIGYRPEVPGEYFKGTLDDVRIYNYARTAKQIVSDMNGGHPSVGSPVGSPVGYWQFDEGYGDRTNNIGSGGSALYGDLAGSGTTCPTAGACPSWNNDGKFQKALSYDGTDDYVDIADNSSLDITDAVTVSAWVKKSNLTATTRHILVKGTRTTGTTNDYALLNDGSNRIRFEISNGGTNYNVIDTTYPINDANWHHVVGVYIPSTALQVYIDGVLRTQNTTSIPAASTANANSILIGRNSSATERWAGLIDEVKVYPYALSADEIKVDYNHHSAQVMGSLSTDSDGVASNSAARAYCPPGNAETSCAAGSDPSPVGEWNLDEATGQTVNDISGNGNSGTLGANSSVSTDDPAWSTGKVGSGLSFDGGDHVQIGDVLDPLTANLSITAWIKTTEVNGASQLSYIVSKRDPAVAANAGFQLFTNDSQSVSFTFSDGGSSRIRVDATSPAVNDNRWHHVAVVYTRSGNGVLYVDGVPATGGSGSISTHTGSSNSAIALRIGKSEASSDWWQGQIDKVRIYNYDLTPAQIAWDYNRGGPVGWWQFDECTGTTAYDASGNSLNGTITIGGTGSYTAAGSCNSGTSTDSWYAGISGKFNSSIALDSTNDYVSISNPSLPTADFAYAFWYYPTDLSGDTLLSNKNGTSQDELRLDSNANGTLTATIDDGSTNLTTTRAVSTSSWYHIVLLRSGSTIKIYINGRQDPTTATRSNALSFGTCELYIGAKIVADTSAPCDTGLTAFAGAKIDDFRIYNYALSDIQIKMIYNQDSAIRFGPSSGTP